MSKKTVISIIIIVLALVLVAGVTLIYKEGQEKITQTENPTATIQGQPVQSATPKPSFEPKEEEPSSSEIEIISPNGGEKWKWGTVQEIKWKFLPEMERKIDAKEIISLSIDINSETGSWYIYREDNLDKNFTFTKWKVGNAGPMPGGFGQMPLYEEHPQPIPNKQYKIRVCGGTSETFYAICDESDASFLILGEQD